MDKALAADDVLVAPDGDSDQKPNEDHAHVAGESSGAPSPHPESPEPAPRTAFTSAGQVEADFALARLIQEQERAFMALRRNDGVDFYFGSSDDWSYGEEDEDDGDEEDEDDRADGADGDDDEVVVVREEGEERSRNSLRVVDPDEEADDRRSIVGSDYGDDVFDPVDAAEFENERDFVQGLYEAQGLVAHMMALFGLLQNVPDNLSVSGNSQIGGDNSQETWQEIDPDNYTYEELIALGELVGSESRGLTADKLAALPVVNYKAENIELGSVDRCVICQLEYEDGNNLVVLSCKHSYHPDCISQWLQVNKVCPVCNTEVSTSDNGKIKD